MYAMIVSEMFIEVIKSRKATLAGAVTAVVAMEWTILHRTSCVVNGIYVSLEIVGRSMTRARAISVETDVNGSDAGAD